ncbi:MULTISPECIES: hypothetical protein [Methylosinus]|uniref:Uncharacterized protein n=1 Tax=Methylosinus trichosporium (strain ATCC 35070 / NCIMB 11131 / UNIQEM 75 / OB3b) TaxID=595536 RepID=A0A2D2D5H0_METT3|nr:MULTISPECIES: hypothetical protein [Methylosinus]ATQ70079.1 hypothetical protein CQW49_20960 [Methylosinus trichosporium OB3b]OBS54246.1 hypothetical protein A8B73_01635 [Methylosinus sp. 3S-1]
MKILVPLLLSAALVAPSGAAFADPADSKAPKYCADSLGRRVICPTREGRSVGSSDEDPDPLLVGGGVLLLGGVTAGALALTNRRNDGPVFFEP